MARDNLGAVLNWKYPGLLDTGYVVSQIPPGDPFISFWDPVVMGEAQPDEDAFLATWEPQWAAAQQTPERKADKVSYDKRVLAAVIRWMQFRQFGRPMPAWATNTLQAAAVKLDDLGIP